MNSQEQKVYDALTGRVYCMVTAHYEQGPPLRWIIDKVSKRMTVQEARDSNTEYYRVEGFCSPFHYKHIPKKERGKRWEMGRQYFYKVSDPYIRPNL